MNRVFNGSFQLVQKFLRIILKEYSYNNQKIPLVQERTKNHRGSVNSEKHSFEELCVADADAISHFDSVPSLLYLAYVQKEMGIQDGKEFVKNKLARSFLKLPLDKGTRA